MSQGIFTKRQQLRGLIEKSWNAQPNTASYSAAFNGSSQWLTLAGPSGLAFGTNNFTIECWVYFNNVSAVQILYDFRATSTNGSNPCVYIASGLLYYYPAGANQITGTTTLVTNTWYHIALCRSGTSTNLYVNGVQQGSTYTDTYTYAVGANRPIIGSNGYGNGSSAWLNGYISNLRILNGTALYTSAFTPPSAPLTAITNTVLLTLNNPTVYDASTNAYPITNTGGVIVDNKNPFNSSSISPPPQVEYLVVAGGGSGGVYWGGGGGAGGVLQGITPVISGTSTTVTVGSGGAVSSVSFQNGNNGSNSVFGNITALGGAGGKSYASCSFPSGGSGGGGSLYVTYGGQGTAGQGNPGGAGTPSGYGQAGGGGGGAGSAGGPGNKGCYGGNGGNGVASAISGILTAYAGGGGGGGNSGQGLGGYGGGGAGVASGTANNGSPNTGGGGGGQNTQPSSNTPTSGSGGSGIVIISYPDLYSSPTLLTGSYTAGTSGSGSFYTNANSFVYTPSSSTYDLGANNFTLEMWINVSTSNNLIRGVNQYGFALLLSGNTLQYYLTSSNGGWNIASGQGGGTVPFNTWTHIALVRNGNVFTPYVNGLAGATTTSSATLYSNNGFTLMSEQPIGSPGGNGLTTGYVSNFRAVIGSAVYTSNFTPSTTPLTAIPNTKVLLNTVSGGYLADSSSLSATMLVGTNTPQWNQSSPFATGLGYKNRVYTWTNSGTVTF